MNTAVLDRVLSRFRLDTWPGFTLAVSLMLVAGGVLEFFRRGTRGATGGVLGLLWAATGLVAVALALGFAIWAVRRVFDGNPPELRETVVWYACLVMVAVSLTALL